MTHRALLRLDKRHHSAHRGFASVEVVWPRFLVKLRHQYPFLAAADALAISNLRDAPVGLLAGAAAAEP